MKVKRKILIKILTIITTLFLFLIADDQFNNKILNSENNIYFNSIFVSADEHVPEKPYNGVSDEKHYLSQKTIDSIVKMNSDFSNSEPRTQVGFYITDTIGYNNINIYANDIARKWEIGYSKNNDNAGVMVLFAIEDHKWSIRTTDYINEYYLSTNDIDEMVENITPELKSGDNDLAIYKLVEQLRISLTPKTKAQISEIEKKHEEIREFGKDILAIIVLIIFCVIGGIIIMFVVSLFEIIICIKRSNKNYQGRYKLYPNDENFFDFNSWSDEDIQVFMDNFYLKKSQFEYDGSDKLYPDDTNFKPNPSWTDKRVNDYFKERSNYNYKGSDKLYPDDVNFIQNVTWTALLIEQYYQNKKNKNSSHVGNNAHHSSSSSWSSSSWSGGGGFGGGGSSGSW